MYSRCIILGSGSLSTQCLRHVLSRGIQTFFVDAGCIFSKLPEEIDITPRAMNFDEIMDFLRVDTEPSLILNIGGIKIVPSDVLAMPRYKFVNYHNSLLPLYKGRNAEAWVIYNREKTTGVTWHQMIQEIDCGDIIRQEVISLTDDITALELLRMQSQLAFKSFVSFFDDLWNDKCPAVPQNGTGNGIYYAKQKPNMGILDIRWSSEHISAFLRSMNYGVLYPLGKGKILYDSTVYNWCRYKIDSCPEHFDSIEIINGDIIIKKSGKCFTLKEVTIPPPMECTHE